MHTLFPVGLSGMPDTKLKLVGILSLIAVINFSLLFVYACAVGAAIRVIF
jgi:hypothetical protein